MCALSESWFLFVLVQHVQLACIFPESPKKSGPKSRFPANLCTWPVRCVLGFWLWMWCYETLLTSSGAVNTPWEPLLSCGFPLPSAISLRSQEPRSVAGEWRKGPRVFMWMCVSTHHAVQHAFDSVDCVCTCTDACVCLCAVQEQEQELDTVHTPVFCYALLARSGIWFLCQMLTDGQKAL